MNLREACREVMNDKGVTCRYTNGLDSLDILTEIRNKFGQDAFPLCTVIDVADEMQSLYKKMIL